jgi:tetratricopeptide (TPR) repeat protein
MQNSSWTHSRLRLRLALSAAESQRPLRTKRRPLASEGENEREEERFAGLEQHAWSEDGSSGDGELEPISDSAWTHLENLRNRFEAELGFADSCLAENPPWSRVAMLLDNSGELRQLAVLQRLMEKGHSLRFDQPDEGLRIVDDILAWSQTNTSPLVSPIRARAFMERGNFLRILSDSDGAYAAFREALRELTENGTRDPLDLARYQEFRGALEKDCGNYRAAVDLLRKALAKIRRWGDSHTLQRVLISTSLSELYGDNFEQAERLLDESLRIPEPDSLLLKFAAVNKVLVYLFSGQPHKAYQCLLRVRNRLGSSWFHGFPGAGRMKVLWTEGNILSALGREEEAIAILNSVRDFFIQSGRGYEVCHISIELAMLFAAQERFREVHRELALALPFCSAQKSLDRYAKAAVLLLQRTLQEQGRLEAEQVRIVAHHLDRIHRAPLKPLPRRPPNLQL